MSNYTFEFSHLLIYKAALHDDWDSVSQLFEQDPTLMTKRINCLRETPLMIAVGTNSSHRFVQKLIERIVAVGDSDKLWVTAFRENNALHHAAKVGNTIDVMILVSQNLNMIRSQNYDHYTPLKLAACHGNKETLRYLMNVDTGSLRGIEEEGSSLYNGVAGGDLITLTIMAGFYDVAFEIIDRHPKIVLESDKYNRTALQILAMKPELFPSGTKLGLWGRLIYSLIPVKKSQGSTDDHVSSIFNKFSVGFWSLLQYLVPGINNIHAIKVHHTQSNLLVNRIFEIVIENNNHAKAWEILGSTISTAVTYGIHELIEGCILTYPSIVWYNVEQDFNLFIAAIKQRQERVYNLVHQMSGHKIFAATQFDRKKDENALHLAAKIAPPHRLKVVSGAALQMQRELQWFKEVEKFVEPSFREALNRKGQTPKMVFTDAHKELLVEGQQWMKDTASSCSLVAALIVTMTFAGAFTVPGGNQDNGKPPFLNKNTFMIFMVSDAIAFFSSSTSVLMFLGILTRYAEDDFLYSLPNKMTIGLVSLFLSLAATMIAFSATVILVLEDKVTWIVAPLVIATSIPVCWFGLLQFPLLMELVYTTYGPSIFYQQKKQMIY